MRVEEVRGSVGGSEEREGQMRQKLRKGKEARVEVWGGDCRGR